MPIKYTRTDLDYFRIFPKSNFEGSVSIIDLSFELRPSLRVGERFRSLQPECRDADAFLFRCTDQNMIPLLASDGILGSQLSKKVVAALCPTMQGKKLTMGFLPVEGFPTPSYLPSLNELREIEMYSLLDCHGAINFPKDYHFELPSGLHSNGFVDVASCLNDSISLSRIADWIMPYVTEDCALLGDSKLMIPLLLQVRYVALAVFGWKLDYGVLQGYPSEPSELIDTLNALKDRSPHNRRILFVLSVNSSGRLNKKVKMYSPSGSLAVTLVHTRHEASEAADTFSTIPIERWELDKHGECEHCDELELVYIDQETLQPRPNATPDPRKPDISMAEAKRNFWEAVSAADAVRLHVNIEYQEESYQRRRHHGIYIDTARLGIEPSFRRVCLGRLAGIQKPGLVIIPKHQNSAVVRDMIHESLRLNPHEVQIISHKETGEVLRSHRDAKRILIADDGIVTGATVRTFKDLIYQFFQPSGSVPELDCFVIIARPTNIGARQSAEFPFRDRDEKHFSYGELVYLPYRDAKCPWCQEYKMLDKYRFKVTGAAKRAIEKRIRHLESEVKVPLLVEKPENFLTLRSFFGNLRPKAAFAAIASVTQALANEIDENRDPFRIKAIDLNFVLKAYFEADFPAGVLRTLDRKYCRTAVYEKALYEFLETYPSVYSYPGLVVELGWAGVQGKLPLEPIRHLLERVPNTDPTVNLLRQLLLVHIGD